MPSLLSGMVLSVFISWFHNVVTLPYRLVLTNFGTWSYQCSLSNFTPISLHMLKCSCTHTVSCFVLYSSFTYIGPADKIGLLSCHIADIVCIWYLCLSVIYLSHYILFVVPDLVLCYFTFSFSFQISPPKPSECVLFTNKLSICTSRILAMHYFAVLFVLWELSEFCFLYVVYLFVSLLLFVWFHSSTAYAVIFTIHVASRDFHFCFFCQSCSMVCLYNFAYTSGMVALSLSEWSILSFLIAVTFLSRRSTVTNGPWFETRSQICLAVR